MWAQDRHLNATDDRDVKACGLPATTCVLPGLLSALAETGIPFQRNISARRRRINAQNDGLSDKIVGSVVRSLAPNPFPLKGLQHKAGSTPNAFTLPRPAPGRGLAGTTAELGTPHRLEWKTGEIPNPHFDPLQIPESARIEVSMVLDDGTSSSSQQLGTHRMCSPAATEPQTATDRQNEGVRGVAADGLSTNNSDLNDVLLRSPACGLCPPKDGEFETTSQCARDSPNENIMQEVHPKNCSSDSGSQETECTACILDQTQSQMASMGAQIEDLTSRLTSETSNYNSRLEHMYNNLRSSIATMESSVSRIEDTVKKLTASRTITTPSVVLPPITSIYTSRSSSRPASTPPKPRPVPPSIRDVIIGPIKDGLPRSPAEVAQALLTAFDAPSLQFLETVFRNSSPTHPNTIVVRMTTRTAAERLCNVFSTRKFAHPFCSQDVEARLVIRVIPTAVGPSQRKSW
ncbi:hypothetical protein V5O48_016454 [Marasmius crinis-equi]|uniref:Uncharacterized protein n=1 Tax=Marasmius crinis-equi TaxID=585013 RepID=A0ABR3ERR1_9AGAR